MGPAYLAYVTGRAEAAAEYQNTVARAEAFADDTVAGAEYLASMSIAPIQGQADRDRAAKEAAFDEPATGRDNAWADQSAAADAQSGVEKAQADADFAVARAAAQRKYQIAYAEAQAGMAATDAETTRTDDLARASITLATDDADADLHYTQNMASADCVWNTGESTADKGLTEDLAAIDAGVVTQESVPNLAESVARLSAQIGLWSAQRAAGNNYNTQVAASWIAYRSADFTARSTSAAGIDTSLGIPWSQFQVQRATADSGWWASQQSAYGDWFSQANGAYDAYQDTVNSLYTTLVSTQAAADAEWSQASAAADQAEANDFAEADDAYVQKLAPAQETYIDAAAQIKRDQIVAQAIRAAGGTANDDAHFQTLLNTAKQTYAASEVAAVDGYRTDTAAAGYTYATAYQTLDNDYATKVDNATAAYLNGESTEFDTLDTSLGGYQRDYYKSEASSYATKMGDLASDHDSPWSQLAADQADAAHTRADSLQEDWLTGITSASLARRTEETHLATDNAARDIDEVEAQGIRSVDEAQAAVDRATTKNAADAAQLLAGTYQPTVPTDYVDWAFSQPDTSVPSADPYATPTFGDPMRTFVDNLLRTWHMGGLGNPAECSSLLTYYNAYSYTDPTTPADAVEHAIRAYPASNRTDYVFDPAPPTAAYICASAPIFAPTTLVVNYHAYVSTTAALTDPGRTVLPASPSAPINPVDSPVVRQLSSNQYAQLVLTAPETATEVGSTSTLLAYNDPALDYDATMPSDDSTYASAIGRFGDDTSVLAAVGSSSTDATSNTQEDSVATPAGTPNSSSNQSATFSNLSSNGAASRFAAPPSAITLDPGYENGVVPGKSPSVDWPTSDPKPSGVGGSSNEDSEDARLDEVALARIAWLKEYGLNIAEYTRESQELLARIVSSKGEFGYSAVKSVEGRQEEYWRVPGVCDNGGLKASIALHRKDGGTDTLVLGVVQPIFWGSSYFTWVALRRGETPENEKSQTLADFQQSHQEVEAARWAECKVEIAILSVPLAFGGGEVAAAGTTATSMGTAARVWQAVCVVLDNSFTQGAIAGGSAAIGGYHVSEAKKALDRDDRIAAVDHFGDAAENLIPAVGIVGARVVPIFSGKASLVTIKAGGGPKAPANVGSLEEATALQGRAQQLNAVRDSWMARNGTTAVANVRNVNTGEIQTWIATESPGAMPGQWNGVLRNGETFIQAPGHAEQTIVNALGNDWVIVSGGSSRNVCIGTCQPLLEEQGLQLGGSTFSGMSNKTPYRMFWRP